MRQILRANLNILPEVTKNRRMFFDYAYVLALKTIFVSGNFHNKNQISKLTGLSRPTTNDLINRLISYGWMRKDGKGLQIASNRDIARSLGYEFKSNHQTSIGNFDKYGFKERVKRIRTKLESEIIRKTTIAALAKKHGTRKAHRRLWSDGTQIPLQAFATRLGCSKSGAYRKLKAQNEVRMIGSALKFIGWAGDNDAEAFNLLDPSAYKSSFGLFVHGGKLFGKPSNHYFLNKM